MNVIEDKAPFVCPGDFAKPGVCLYLMYCGDMAFNLVPFKTCGFLCCLLFCFFYFFVSFSHMAT